MPSQLVKRLIAILRSACVGIAGVVGAMFLWAFAVLFWAAKSVETSPHPDGVRGGEVGIDVVTLVHNFPVSAKVIGIVGFAVGFALGLRYFGRSLRQT